MESFYAIYVDKSINRTAKKSATLWALILAEIGMNKN